MPHRGAGDAWRAHQAFQRVRVLCRETKGFQSLDLCIARAGAWDAGILGSWEAVAPASPRAARAARIPVFQVPRIPPAARRRPANCTGLRLDQAGIRRLLAITRLQPRHDPRNQVRELRDGFPPWPCAGQLGPPLVVVDVVAAPDHGASVDSDDGRMPHAIGSANGPYQVKPCRNAASIRSPVTLRMCVGNIYSVPCQIPLFGRCRPHKLLIWLIADALGILEFPYIQSDISFGEFLTLCFNG